MMQIRLGDVVESVGGGTPSKSRPEYYGGSIPWVTPKDMKVAEIGDSQVRITDAGLANSSARLVPAGSVLVVVRSGVLKHTLPVALATATVAMNQDMRALIPNATIDSRYLAHLLRAKSSVVLRWVRATTADNFPVSRLMDMEIPLPALEEQRRIARILDSAESLRAKRRLSLATGAQLPAAIYRATSAHLPAHTVPLGDVATVASGITKGRRLNGHEAVDIPYLAVSNVQAGRLDLGVVKRIAVTTGEIDRYRLEPGDLLLTEGGDPDKLGRGALWSGELEQCIHQNHIFRVRVHDAKVLHPVFLQAQVAAPPARAYFLRAAKQTTGIASINKTQLSALPVRVPSSGVQRRFAEQVGAAERALAGQERHLSVLDELFASLQSRAFSGQL